MFIYSELVVIVFRVRTNLFTTVCQLLLGQFSINSPVIAVYSIETEAMLFYYKQKEEAQLNDSIWKLYAPDEGEPDADIIFFHGLQTGDYEEAFWKTWRAKDQEQLIWPKDWLSKILPNARILSVSYNSSAKHVKGESTDQGDMELLGEILVDDIVLDKRSDIGQTCPVFLVGHCLGGIVIKQFILSVINEKTSFQPRDDQNENEQSKVDRTATFLKNFKGAYFYGTPNGGIPNNVTPFANLLTSPSPILKFLRTLDTHRGRINEDFRQLRSNRHVLTHGIGEARATHCEVVTLT